MKKRLGGGIKIFILSKRLNKVGNTIRYSRVWGTFKARSIKNKHLGKRLFFT